MFNRWSKYFKNPFFIGSVLSVLVIFALAKFLPFYITEIIEESVITNNGEIYFFDLDHDGNSEKLNYYHYDRIFQPTLYLYDSKDKLITFWSFQESPIEDYKIFTGDYDGDSKDEIYVFTTNADSVFLHVLLPEKVRKPIVNRKFIAKVNSEDTNLKLTSIGLFDLDLSGNKEFIFTIDGGYPISPRKIFSYDIDKGTLMSSAEINVDIQFPVFVADIYADGRPEIIINNKSFDNLGNGNKSQLMVLDHTLNYLFEPMDFYGGLSQISAMPIRKEGEVLLAVLHSGTSNRNVFNVVMLYDVLGEKLDELNIKSKSNLTLTSLADDENNLYLFSGKKMYKYSPQLTKTETYKLSRNDNLRYYENLDLIGDKKKEYVFRNNKELVVFSNNLRHKAKFNIKGSEKIILTNYIENNKTKAISIQSGEKWSLYEFYENKAFFFSLFFYLFIFVVITFIVFIIKGMKFDHVILKKKIFSINEEDLLRQIEENLKEKFTDLKSHVGKISEDKNDNSYQQIISKIDDTYKEFKSVSKKFKESSIQTNSLKQILTDLTKTKESIIVSLKTFSEDDFKGVNKQVKKSIIEFYESCVNFIADFSVNHKLNVQIIEHSKYINILFEVEELFIEKEELTNNALLKTILEKVHGKMEMANISNYGTIINASVPLDLKHPDNSKADKRTRIIIAEDHDVSLFGLISLFKTKEDIEVIGTAKNGMEVLKLLETEDTDIVITDISMPGMDGIELAESLKNKHPQIKVIVFTMYLENWFVEQLINHGAKGFVSKNSKATELVSAVRSVMEGNNYYCPQFKSKFGFKGANNGITQKLDSLSKNELHIIKQYAENLSKEQIAEKMDISPKTMDNFIANILLKLNAGDEDEIIHIAKKQKFISE